MRLFYVFLTALLGFSLFASPLVADQGADPLDRNLYGVQHSLDGGTVRSQGCTLVIPADWRVIDINASVDRLYVCAAYWSENEDLRRSELWAFPLQPDGGDIAFENRAVLASYKLRGGEALNLCRRAISCQTGVALFVQQWEHGATRVFDHEGAEIPVEWPSSKAVGGNCCVDFIQPVAWVPGDSLSFELACIVYELGDMEPYILFWAADSGIVERGPLNEILAKRGASLFVGFDRFW